MGMGWNHIHQMKSRPLIVVNVFVSSRTTVLAAVAFLDAFQKVADMATNTRGRTAIVCSLFKRNNTVCVKCEDSLWIAEPVFLLQVHCCALRLSSVLRHYFFFFLRNLMMLLRYHHHWILLWLMKVFPTCPKVYFVVNFKAIT